MRTSIAVLALVLLAGCETNSDQQAAATDTAPRPVVLDVVEMTATVEDVDIDGRQVTLVEEDGDRRMVLLGSEVRNLDQIEVGDQVKVRYHMAVAAALRDPDTTSQAAQVTATAVQAPLGAKPETKVAREITTTVQIQAVDPDGPTVSFTGPNGVLRMIRVRDPDMQTFARTLKPGDEVDITYIEAVALSVEPAS